MNEMSFVIAQVEIYVTFVYIVVHQGAMVSQTY